MGARMSHAASAVALLLPNYLLLSTIKVTFLGFSGHIYNSIQFSLVAQSCPTLCEPMDCSMPGFPVHHPLPELAQTLVH